MHIPDGYLSPSTCAALYAGAAPFWYLAAQRVKSALHSRAVPLIALFAAFSFVISMFNLPLPGGTTGHAAGIAIAAIVVGPWAAMLSLSVALAVQAFFFGDGGITALGANSLNIAIAGPLVAYAVYRTIGARSAIGSRRRVIAAAVAGYVSINVAALLTAIEFGIQPLLFTDAAGAPLYAPYPLSVAIPAMMLGHLTIAGLAEALVTAGVVRWLQHHEPELLSSAAVAGDGQPASRLRPLWVSLALLMLLTPLGLLAAGTAWGEWSPEEIANTPAGLARLSAIWTAPVPDYAPTFLRSEAFGYVMSAMAGTGLIVLIVTFASWASARRAAAQ